MQSFWEPNYIDNGERFWCFADRGVHICWSMLMSSLFLLWLVFFSAFPGESGIIGTRSSKWKTAACGDSHGTSGSHAEWPSTHCSGELHHSPADCPAQGECDTASFASCVKIIVVVLREIQICPGAVQLWSQECAHCARAVTYIKILKQITWKWFGCQKL